MIWIIFILICFYAILIGEFAVAHWRLPEYKRVKQDKQIRFSILIPFRNEASNLPRLLKSIASLQYPDTSFEIILIDDASTDGSVAIIQEFIKKYSALSVSSLPSIRQSGSPKKDALSLGIDHANYEWIITTDADCAVEKTWLHSLNHFIQTYSPKMIVAPVSINTTHPVSLVNAYEQLDFMSLMGATIGGFGIKLPFLCNGANLAYEKDAFLQVNGYTNNDHIASGDDHFLLEKFVETFPKKVRYLNTMEAGVTTQPQSSWKTLFSQRIRWASKTSGYTFWFSKMVGLVVFLANFITALLLLMIPFVFLGEYAFAKALSKEIILLSLFIKCTIDFVLIARTATFFAKSSYLKWYPFIMLLYPFITTFIAFKALTSSYEWKGRRFKQ